ncbi:MAG: hybrid sensor histidine kinase/response regulator [Deltaproteobacteria bacterium]|nr:hybrid sensor histidine kinase/response regulator [Deltaproteobacteria bacterium]
MEKEKIFVVEDSDMMREVIKSLINEKLGLDVVSAADFADARRVLNTCKSEIFLALLDFRLPDAPNGEIIDYVLSENIPVIVFTGQNSHDVREYIWSKRVVDYVEKGNVFSLDYVCQAITNLKRNSNIKVLVVDDSVVARNYLTGLLKIHDYTIFEASNGKEALEILGKEKDIKLVITDYSMAVMDGFQLTTEIRNKYSKDHLAVIGISGVGKHSISAKFLKCGANDYVNKPIINEELYYRVNNNLEQLERVRALEDLNNLKNEFLGIAAHDLRAPLSSIEGFCDLIESEEPNNLSDLQKQFISRILNASQRMLVLVNDLLDVSSIESGRMHLKLQVSSLPDLIEERIAIGEHMARKKDIKIHYHKKDALPTSFDDRLLTQVLDNLLSNAIKFSDRGKNIYVDFEIVNDTSRVSIRDEGPGISPEDQEKLFYNFNKLSTRPTAGEICTGLGLMIVKKIIDAHQGKVWIESKGDKGSTFIFSIPVGA